VNQRSKHNQGLSSNAPAVNQRNQRSTLGTLNVNGVTYEVRQLLSLPHRQRGVVWSSLPPPRGTFYTLLDVANSLESNQFLNCLQQLPKRQSSLPSLRNFDCVDGRLRIIVDWCEGIDLQKYLDRALQQRSFLPIGVWEAIRRMRALAHACCVLHQDCRIIHGDIKPSNLILPSERIPICLIDFGSSWQIEKTRGRFEGDGSDPFYSAPEVFENEAIVDGRADQFSIAVILFQMLTGQLPYERMGGKAGHAQCRKEFEGTLELVSNLSPQVRQLPDDLTNKIDQLMNRSLSLDPVRRFATMRAFANALDEIFKQLESTRVSAVDPQVHSNQLPPKPSLLRRLFGG
jgi:serine/threonine protein kinase